ncbi:MAG: 5-(carboxyamino)imidazole ribonucleotide mutase [Syntrophorhabdaceae bacterium]|nr:5-(carboxyamino)imidazole ribonucleotide mutase [Syntrophorhabdaceae bacterium]
MESPKILIVLGSESDLPVVEDGVKLLKEMEVPFILDVSSAHRNPEKTTEYAKNARERGIEVIIAVAGMAAHLPGVIAAHTTLPVIGVPTKGGILDGLDALLSIVQMPKGVPVATVAVGAFRNAAILACQILSIKYPEVTSKLNRLKEDMKRQNKELNEKLDAFIKKI